MVEENAVRDGDVERRRGVFAGDVELGRRRAWPEEMEKDEEQKREMEKEER